MTISGWLNFGCPVPLGRGSVVGWNLGPPNNFWMKRAIRFKFGTEMEDGPRLHRQCAVFASLWTFFSFLTVLIPKNTLDGIWHFKTHWLTEPPCVGTTKRPLSGRDSRPKPKWQTSRSRQGLPLSGLEVPQWQLNHSCYFLTVTHT